MVSSSGNKMSCEVFSRYRCTLLRLSMLPLLLNFQALGNPTGGTVTHGSATFSISGSHFNINQTSANAFINWQSFNIGAGETVNFNQPSSSSLTFNQINDPNASQILGNLNANGYVILENANGFYVGGQASITAHGLVMTTAVTPINLAGGGPWSFAAPPPSAKIQNYGQINITGGGTAFLIAADIVNGGTITAPNGNIGLYDGETVLVSTSPNGQGLSAEVTLPQGSVDNEGKLTADGGSVVAQARFVNQNGIIQANSAQNMNGTIELLGGSSVNLGANSVISAQGGSQGVSPGGTVTIKAGDTFSDQPGSAISVAGGAQGGNGGQVEISAPQMGTINTVIDGQARAGFVGGKLTIDPSDLWLDSANTAPSGYTFIDIGSFNGLSQINLQADDDIVLNTIWQLLDQSTASTLSLAAGNNIILNPGSGISAGQDWTVNLTAGTGFVPTTAQPTPASGSDGIYLESATVPYVLDSYIQSQNGDINLWAANEIQVGWMGAANLPAQPNLGAGSITTINDGNITATTLYGDVNTGSNPNGFSNYGNTAPYDTVSSDLGGISTAAGGNITIAAGGDVISYTPADTTATPTALQGDAGTGAFGAEPGNVTITAGGSVYGHYIVMDGAGTIVAWQNAGSSTENFSLSLSSGGWSVNAPNGNIYLQEVRNPNGVFNNAPPPRRGTSAAHLFTYNPNAYVDLTANGVYLTGDNVPRPNGDVPILYPPILDIMAGSGGVTLENNVTLFPSANQNLDIVTTGGGNFTGTAGFENPFQFYMSDSAQQAWSGSSAASGAFSTADHGGLANEPNESSPVFIDISGNMQDLDLIIDKVADIMVGGNMIDCSFAGQNLQAGDTSSIFVAGQIYNTSPYSFVDLSQGIPAIPAGDLLPGMGNSWQDIFTLAISPGADLSPSILLPGTPVSQWANDILQSAGLFTEQILNGQLTGLNPGFVYNPATGRLGFAGPMPSGLPTELGQSITILHLVNGVPVINPATGKFETDTISWADALDLGTLYTESQGTPTLSAVQPGYRIGGPGQFNITAGSISLGNSAGIASCGIYDPQGGYDRYGNLSSITPVAATINVLVTGSEGLTYPLLPAGPDNPYVPSLDMLTSTIASLDGGDVNVVDAGGSMDLGSPELISSTGGSSAINATGTHLAFGIYSTGGGNVNVTAQGDVDIDGSRIATYDGGNILVESLTGNINIGSGSDDLNTVDVVYNSPDEPYQEDVFGSGIVANTLVPALPGQAFPPDAAKVPGNITVLTPQGDIIAGAAGIVQEALDGTLTPGPTVTLQAGTFPTGTPGTAGYSPGYTGNIDSPNSDIIGGSVNVSANGNINIGKVVSRQNSSIHAAQNFTGTVLSGGSANVAAGGSVAGTIVGVGGVNVSGGDVSASLLGQNVNVNGGASQDTLGSSAAATSATQSAAQQASTQSQQQVALDQTTQDDDKKKKKTQIRKIGRVTVILAAAQ